MKRITGLKSHLNIQELLIDIGIPLTSKEIEQQISWKDDVAYEFNHQEIESIETQTNELFEICLSEIEKEIKQGDYQGYHFSAEQKTLIERSWQQNKLLCCGAFEFAYNGESLHLQKCNFNELQSLLEASLFQWKWLENIKTLEDKEQYNHIHQTLCYHLSEIKREFSRLNMLEPINCQLSYFKDLLNISGWEVQYISKEQLLSTNFNQNSMIAMLTPHQFYDKELISYILEHDIKTLEPAWAQLLSHPKFLESLYSQRHAHSFLSSSFIKDRENNEIILSVWLVGNMTCGLSIREKNLEKVKQNNIVFTHYFI